MTRDNNARIRTETDRQVVNRAVWQVTARHPNGALTVVSERWGDRVFLPPSYVAEHVELAYATTIAGVQGLTVDGGRALYDERTSRSELYVAMTRGRHFNIGYGVLEAVSDTDERQAARSAAGLFARAVGNDSRESSAMEAFAEELATQRQHRAPRRHPRRLDDGPHPAPPRRPAHRRRRRRASPRPGQHRHRPTRRPRPRCRPRALRLTDGRTGRRGAPGRRARGHHPARPAVDGHDRRAARQCRRRPVGRAPRRLPRPDQHRPRRAGRGPRRRSSRPAVDTARRRPSISPTSPTTGTGGASTTSSPRSGPNRPASAARNTANGSTSPPGSARQAPWPTSPPSGPGPPTRPR